MNSLITLHGGTPLNILAGTNRSGTGENRDRVDVVGDPFAGFSSAIPNSLAIQYITKAAFANPAIGTFGNIGRNALYGPGFGAVDFSVFKNTPITEKAARRVPRGDLQPDQSHQLRQPGHDVLIGQLRPDHVDAQRRVGARPGLRRTPQYATRSPADLLIENSGVAHTRDGEGDDD